MTNTSGARPRFEFGRHETFPVRHGWLAKGLGRVLDTGGFRADRETADALGLGSRMAKSLGFWLKASGLATIKLSATGAAPKRREKGCEWQITALGEAVIRYDPYLEYPVTWWFVHMSLARQERTVWGWFFNEFHERHFSRETCVTAFLDHTTEHASSQPSAAVAQRDVACLLQAYAVPAGGGIADPEDASVCPLRELGLLIRHNEVHRFEKARPLDAVPVEPFMACVATLAAELESDSVSFADLMRRQNGPARILGLGTDQVETMAEAAVAAYSPDGVQINLLGAERHLVLPKLTPSAWFEAHFRRIGMAVA